MKRKTLGDNQLLNLRWMKFEQLSFTARQLNIPQAVGHRILQKHLKFGSYSCQLLQHVIAQDGQVCYTFSMTFKTWSWWTYYRQNCLPWWSHILFNGIVNRHNPRNWGSNSPHELIEHIWSPELNMFGGLSELKVFGYFFFTEHTVTVILCLDMLEEFFMPLQEEEDPDDILI
jgi:hypothetical protein